MTTYDDSFDFEDEDSNSFLSPTSELDQLFQFATLYVRKNASNISNKDALLYLYSRFKYVNEGTCNTDRPGGLFNFDGKAKWDAWKSLGDKKSKEECKQEYITKLNQVTENWRSGFSFNNNQNDNSGNQISKAEQKGTFGVKCSTMMNQEEQENDLVDHQNLTIFDLVKISDLDRLKTFANISKNVNEVDENGMTLLMWACDRGNLEIIKYLCEDLSADLNRQDSNGQSALHYAVSCDYIDIVKYLKGRQGINLSLVDSDGQKAIDLTHNQEIIVFLNC
jgi:acyl-CoA-binding protein